MYLALLPEATWLLGRPEAQLGALGTVVAIPMKRNLINVERLRFPSGIAAAITLRSLHGDTLHKPALQGPTSELSDGMECGALWCFSPPAWLV